jgi:hypothetical protein
MASYSFNKGNAFFSFIILIAAGRISAPGTEKPFTCRNMAMNAFLSGTIL